jgi:hypothetical protein
MSKKRVKAILAIVVLLAVVVLAWAWNFAELHFIREDGGGGTVLWNADEAYLFVYDFPDGFVLTIPQYFAEPIREYFHAPVIPVDSKRILTVLHVTSSGMDRHSQAFVASLNADHRGKSRR